MNRKYALIHRVLPDIQIVYFKDFEELNSKEYWVKYLETLPKHCVLEPKYSFENRKMGAGCPPIKTDKGWLIIFHVVERTNEGSIYHASAALLDLNDPLKVVGRLSYPLISPEKRWEKAGDVSNVVFPTGTALFDGRLYVYYGAADKRIAAFSVELKELLDELSK